MPPVRLTGVQEDGMNRKYAMSTAERGRLHDTGSEEVLRWRFDVLVRANYDVQDAIEVAAHIEVDLHAAVALRTRGCPSATAVRILI